LQGEIPSNARHRDLKLRQPLTSWLAALRSVPAQREPYVMGFLSAQVAYNAAALKDEKSDRGDAAGLGKRHIS